HLHIHAHTMIYSTHTHTHTHTHAHQTSVTLLGNFFTLYQDCINLRIKPHTTKNIINNKLLLWQRGVHGFRPLLQPTLLQKECSGFRTLFNPSLPLKNVTDFMERKCSQFMQENTPILYHLVLGSRDKNVYLPPKNPDSVSYNNKSVIP